MKKILILIFLIFAFSLPVCAETDIYQNIYEGIGGDDFENNLGQDVKQFFNDNDIEPSDINWVNKLSEKDVLLHIIKFLTGGIKAPIKAAAVLIGVLLISAAITSFGTVSNSNTAVCVAVLAITAMISGDIWQSVYSAVNAIKATNSFMLSFVPVFASMVALSGKSVTAVSMNTLLLTACEVVSFVASFVILPLMGGYLALSISMSVSPLLHNTGIAENIKKISIWILSFIGTLFAGVLGVQTTVNSAADTVALRTAKFILGTSVPVVGGILGDAVSTVSSSIELLRSSFGIYGVVAIALILLPILLELVVWRFSLNTVLAVSELFSLSKTTVVLKAVDAMISVLISVLLMVGILFIISLTIVITAVKG